MFEKLKGFFINILSLFHTSTIEEVTGVKTSLSRGMFSAVELWVDLLHGCAPWNSEVSSCGIVSQISGELAKMVKREIGLEIKNEALVRPMTRLNKNVDKIVQYMATLGGCLVRPVVSANYNVTYQLTPFGSYLPTARDFDGTLLGCIILKQINENGKKYILIEAHNFDGVNETDETKLFLNDNGVLKPANLNATTQTANITPLYTWQNCGRPLFVEFRTHLLNTIDDSDEPIALINGAIDLIEKADRQFDRMNWEQEAGEKKVFADKDLFRKIPKKHKDATGKEYTTYEGGITTKSMYRLVQQIDGDGSKEGQKIVEYNPALRTEAQNAFFQQILKRIELTLNVGKGSISDAEQVQQTATQYNGGRSELFAIIDDLEDEIELKYHDVAEVFAYICAAYGLGKYNADIVITWNDDQTRKDVTASKTMALQEINAGVMNKSEYRVKFYGETPEEAEKNTPKEEPIPAPFGL